MYTNYILHYMTVLHVNIITDNHVCFECRWYLCDIHISNKVKSRLLSLYVPQTEVPIV